MMSKKLYIGIYAASLSLCILFVIVLAMLLLTGVMKRYENQISNPLLIAGFVIYFQFIVVQTVYVFVILSKMWGAIQDGQTQVTVGKAIGYLFIPIFNVYWIFKAWGSFPVEYNNYVDRYALPVPKLAGGVFVAYPILLLLTAILYVPLLALPFVFITVIAKTCDAVNAVGEAVRQRHEAVRQTQILDQYAAME